MKKLVYLKAWRETEKPNVVCVHKSNKEELITLFKNFEYKIDIVNFNDDKSVALYYNDYNITKIEFWFKVFELLLKNGYKFTDTVQSRYDWYKSKIEEEIESKKQEEFKRLKEQEELKKALAQKQTNTILWCWENGCETTLTACSKCRFTNRGITCEPVKVVIETKNGKQYIRRV